MRRGGVGMVDERWQRGGCRRRAATTSGDFAGGGGFSPWEPKHAGSAVEFHVCFGATDALHVMAFVGFGFMLCGCLFGDFRWGAMLYIESL